MSYFGKLVCVCVCILAANNFSVQRVVIMSPSVWLQATTSKFHKSFKTLPFLCYKAFGARP